MSRLPLRDEEIIMLKRLCLPLFFMEKGDKYIGKEFIIICTERATKDNGERIFQWRIKRLDGKGNWRVSYADIPSCRWLQWRFERGDGYAQEQGLDTYKVHSFINRQPTGVHDRNGKIIYEGDVVKWSIKTASGEIKTIYGLVRYNNKGDLVIEYYEFSNRRERPITKGIDVGVIGNIYDNFELLKKVKGEE